MARALLVQRREIWQVMTGLLSDQLRRANQALATHKGNVLFTFSPLCCFLKHHSSCQRLGSHGTTAPLPVFPFVTAANGASACGFLGVRMFAFVKVVGSYNSRNQEHRKSQEQRSHSACYTLFQFCFCYAVCRCCCCCCCCVPVSRRNFLTL